jgi:nitrogen fixation NifU-like protein
LAGILIFVPHDLPIDARADRQFFFQLSDQGRFRRFARFHLSARELPFQRMLPRAFALGNQDAAIPLDQRCHHSRHNKNETAPLYSEAFLDHFKNPRNVGELAAPAVTVEISNPACGDILRLSARFEDGRVAEVRYKIRGCTASIASGSALTEWMVGKTRAQLAALNAAAIESAVGGLIPESKHAAVLCVDGVKALLKVR